MSYPTADAAAEAFYRAFADGDVVTMAEIWLDDTRACCVHPAREPVIGHGPVMDSWREILLEASSFDISYHAAVQLDNEDLVVHVGVERLTTGSGQVALLSVTNAFRRMPDGWRIVLHHAAPVQQPVATVDDAVH